MTRFDKNIRSEIVTPVIAQSSTLKVAELEHKVLKSSYKSLLLSGLVLVVFLILWEGTVRTLSISALVLPGPLKILGSLWDNLSSGFFLIHIWTTLAEIIMGFGLGSLFGSGLGALLFHLPAAQQVVRPYIIASQALPKLALAPIFVLWFGFDLTPKVIITALIVFFPLFENTLVGMSSPGREEIELFRVLKAGPFQTFWRLRLPSSLPFIFAGLRIGAILSVVGAVVSEYVGANRGLGALIIASQGTLDTAEMFAVFFLLTLIGLILYACVNLVESLVLSRRATN